MTERSDVGQAGPERSDTGDVQQGGPERSDVEQGGPERSELKAKALRTTRGFAGKAMLIVFGVGLGIALSVAWIERPDEIVNQAVGGEELADGQQAAGPGGAARKPGAKAGPADAAGGRAGGGGTRIVTSGQGGPGVAQGGPVDGGAGPTGVPVVPAGRYECAPGKNGGSTAPGVTGNSIKVAANVVLDGPGASFLREAIVGIQAVIDEANVKGICGRKIELTHRNDGWDGPTGLQYIENYINDKNFAIIVNPSSEGLDRAVQNGVIDRAGIPVVGSDGMLISQYRWPRDSDSPGMSQWVWPVAASTVSTMHITVQHAVERGACSFGLVYDKVYRFGREGATAFKDAINKIGTGKGGCKLDLQTREGIVAGENTYSTEAFNNACGSDGQRCDLVAMLLDPSTAITWIKSGGAFGAKLTTGPQTLFNEAFAVNCVKERQKLKKACSLIVWTGYNPPVGALANLPDVNKYVNAIKSRNAQADEQNSFTEGAYLGAKLFVDALRAVGPELTRERLRAALDALTYRTDLSNPLSWSPSSHFANTAMHAFRVGFTPQGFTGWQDENTGWVKDRWVGYLTGENL